MTNNTDPVPTVKDCIDNWFQLPFPDYNMGLLPDEEGFDSDKLAANYKTEADKEVARDVLKRICASERVKALIRLEQWAKLHNLDAGMILDGIEHMALSELQNPTQRHVDYPERYAELQTQLEGETQ